MTTSTLTKKQVKAFRKDYTENGKPVTIIAKVRFDDQCGNGHNTFSITADIFESHRHPGEETIVHESGKTMWLSSCGCCHDEIAKHFPQLRPLIKWHLCSTDGPMHGVSNAIYHAGDRDCWGMRKGEKRQIRNGKTGVFAWNLVAVNDAGEEIELHELTKHIDANDKPPCPYRLEYRPWCRIGEGKERDLDAARSAAVWPEATDEELTADGLRERLEARLPMLLDEFRSAVESLGFTW